MSPDRLQVDFPMYTDVDFALEWLNAEVPGREVPWPGKEGDLLWIDSPFVGGVGASRRPYISIKACCIYLDDKRVRQLRPFMAVRWHAPPGPEVQVSNLPIRDFVVIAFDTVPKRSGPRPETQVKATCDLDWMCRYDSSYFNPGFVEAVQGHFHSLLRHIAQQWQEASGAINEYLRATGAGGLDMLPTPAEGGEALAVEEQPQEAGETVVVSLEVVQQETASSEIDGKASNQPRRGGRTRSSAFQGVGTDALDTVYWALWGSFSEQRTSERPTSKDMANHYGVSVRHFQRHLERLKENNTPWVRKPPPILPLAQPPSTT